MSIGDNIGELFFEPWHDYGPIRGRSHSARGRPDAQHSEWRVIHETTIRDGLLVRYKVHSDLA